MTVQVIEWKGHLRSEL